MDQQQNDFYQKIRAQINDWATSEDGTKSEWINYVLVAPDLFHLLCKLVIDKNVPASHKTKLVIVIAYFVSPVDLVPEGIVGPIGFVDDIALTAYALNSLLNEVEEKVVLKHWVGDNDLLKLIQEVLKVADEMVGSGLWSKIKGMFG